MFQENDKEGDYIGNLWGKKYTFYAFVIVVSFIALALGRYAYLKLTGQYPVEYEKQELIQNEPVQVQKAKEE